MSPPTPHTLPRTLLIDALWLATLAATGLAQHLQTRLTGVSPADSWHNVTGVARGLLGVLALGAASAIAWRTAAWLTRHRALPPAQWWEHAARTGAAALGITCIAASSMLIYPRLWPIVAAAALLAAILAWHAVSRLIEPPATASPFRQALLQWAALWSGLCIADIAIATFSGPLKLTPGTGTYAAFSAAFLCVWLAVGIEVQNRLRPPQPSPSRSS